MTRREFIQENRAEIDNAIARAYGENCKPSNDSERSEWIDNDESLYTWERMERRARRRKECTSMFYLWISGAVVMTSKSRKRLEDIALKTNAENSTLPRVYVSARIRGR